MRRHSVASRAEVVPAFAAQKPPRPSLPSSSACSSCCERSTTAGSLTTSTVVTETPAASLKRESCPPKPKVAPHGRLSHLGARTGRARLLCCGRKPSAEAGVGTEEASCSE